MNEHITEITLTNEDGEQLRIRRDKDDDDVAQIEIHDNTFWFACNEWSMVTDAIGKICGS